MLRFLTAGESHGKGLSGIIEGMPSGLALTPKDIDAELQRRQGGYGRGGRMKIESDRVEMLSGVRWGETTGAPISLFIENKDWPNWQKALSAAPEDAGSLPPFTKPRPGHADLPGALKFAHADIRNILERSSARETAMRVALGAVAKKLLREFGIAVGSFVFQIGKISAKTGGAAPSEEKLRLLFKKAEASPLRCPDKAAEKEMKALIDRAAKAGDTVGGAFSVFILGLPPGLGSHTHWDRRLDGLLARAVMSVQAIKGVEVGGGFALAALPGSKAMDEIYYEKKRGFYRKTNNMGGIEGGMTNGMPVVLHAAMKPIPTLKGKKALRSVDIISKEPFRAAYERSDTCAVPAAAVVAEAMAGLAMAEAFLEKFGGDSIAETRRNHDAYRRYLLGF